MNNKPQVQNNGQPNRYPIASLNTHPTTERAIDIMEGYIIRYQTFIEIINKNKEYLHALNEYVSINKFFLNRKTESKDKLRNTLVNSLVEMNIYSQIEAKWLRYHDYFELFIQMLQTSKAISNILYSNGKTIG